MMSEEEELVATHEDHIFVAPVEENVPAEISIHAMYGPNSISTFRLLGTVGKHTIQLLIDTGSTHTFLDEATARKLQLQLEDTNPMVNTTSRGMRDGDWSRLDSQHSPVEFDWLRMTLTLTSESSKITLKAATIKADLQLISAKKLNKLIKQPSKSAIGHLFTLQANTTPVAAPELPKHPPALTTVLSQFQEVFSMPTSLPPSRIIDHSIMLKPNSQAKRFPHYRHSHAQKLEIETIVSELLSSGFITPSHSEFASPIILVKKKDGTWRFCVDYRFLNDMTIKHDFRIPLVDELLDELQRQSFFPKST
ncbi:hypothetical protein LIER_33866 [Lithospermum erythrorhizon]|uniref:Transposon Ty3-I Gag-Pol polyprotein n=1 Tax=Lithospermum erythrorhizon TaxID=34254 RepID=A0AAV3RZN8_LITER